jgi:nucleotide-binding universal stress UspA family protein
VSLDRVGNDGAMAGPFLVATHLSKTADEVVEQAARMAAGLGVELHAVSVVPEVSVGAPLGAAGVDAITHRVEMLQNECARALEHATTIGRAAGLEVRKHLVHGEPASQIATVADEVGADMIVVGSRGLDPAGRYVLGSVPERLLFDPHGHHVLVVRTA